MRDNFRESLQLMLQTCVMHNYRILLTITSLPFGIVLFWRQAKQRICSQTRKTFARAHYAIIIAVFTNVQPSHITLP